MSTVHKWWEDRPSEVFWLEVTRRKDLGVNLKAPQTNEGGLEFWSYSLVQEVKEGDWVYHYDGVAQAIVARSRAVGTVWGDDIVWAARGSSARSANISPHLRRGWYFGLESYETLHVPITLNTIRGKVDEVRMLRDVLTAEVGEPLYFPFEIGTKRPIRPMQGYLFKLPQLFLSLFETVSERASSPTLPLPTELGAQYRQADELTSIRDRDPFSIDPALVERGVRSHATTQNSLADFLRSCALSPRSPKTGEPDFDIAWRIAEKIFVAEVKSLTEANEEKQLRLGLGQVLRYAHQLDRRARTVPVLVVERMPKDSSWEHLCKKLGVLLVWPGVFADRLIQLV